MEREVKDLVKKASDVASNLHLNERAKTRMDVSLLKMLALVRWLLYRVMLKSFLSKFSVLRLINISLNWQIYLRRTSSRRCGGVSRVARVIRFLLCCSNMLGNMRIAIL